MPPRVYFDSNDGDESGRYLLGFPKSKADLAKIEGGPQEGMLVTIYMVGEIEMEAHLTWNPAWNSWVGRPDLSSVRDNTESWDDHKT